MRLHLVAWQQQENVFHSRFFFKARTKDCDWDDCINRKWKDLLLFFMTDDQCRRRRRRRLKRIRKQVDSINHFLSSSSWWIFYCTFKLLKGASLALFISNLRKKKTFFLTRQEKKVLRETKNERRTDRNHFRLHRKKGNERVSRFSSRVFCWWCESCFLLITSAPRDCIL